MSPEQAAGATADPRADVYSAGVLLFEALTGRWPFEAEDRLEMLRAHLMQPPPTLTERHETLRFRPELEAVVARALAKEKEDRFADAGEMLEALRAVPRPLAQPKGAPPRFQSTGAGPAGRRAFGRWVPWALGAGLLLLLAAAGGLAAWWLLR